MTETNTNETQHQLEVSWIPLSAAGLLKVKLPDTTVKFLTELTDVILEDDPELDILSMDDRLAGQIKAGKQRAIPLTEETKKSKAMANFLTFSHNLCLEYLNGYMHYSPKAKDVWGTSPGVEIYEFWANKQLAGDYNPLHNHCQPFAALSSVIYLKVPEQIISNTDYKSEDGLIKFMWSDRGNTAMIEYPGMATFTPQVGDYYIFPSWLNHEVPPFRGEGERRSLSWNAKLWV
jgi:hypothetical protein